MVFLLLYLKTQLAVIYKRLGFKELLREWINQDSIIDIMSDIYDENI